MLDKVKRLIARALPKSVQQTSRDFRSDPPAIAHTLDVDTLADILREAEAGNTDRLFATYRDMVLAHAHLQGEFAKRKLAVLGDTMLVVAHDKSDTADTSSAEAIEFVLDEMDGKLDAFVHLLDASLYPVAVAEKIFAPAPAGSGLRFVLKKIVPVPHHHLDFIDGRLRIKEFSSETSHHTGNYFEPDPARYIIHRGHLLTSTPDNWGGPMRAALFWWLFATMDRGWWIRFLDRFGSPFIVGKYEQSDDATRSILERAFSLATKIGGLVVSTDTQVELQQANSVYGDSFKAFHETANAELSKLIVGQTMTAEAQAGGIGGTQAAVHNQVRGDIRAWDATKLAETLRTQVAAQLIAANGLPGRCPRISWGQDDAEINGDLLRSLRDAGLEVTDEGIDQVSRRLGFPLQRIAGGGSPLALTAFSANPGAAVSDQARDANDSVARHGAAGLQRVLGTAIADPVSAVVSRSTSAADLEARLAALTTVSDLADVEALAGTLEPSLVTHAANALARNP